MRFLWLVAGALCCAGTLGAQDSIYKLAVDSAKFPEQGTVLLLDEGAVTVEADGRHTVTYHQVTQILRDRAVASRREQRLVYDPTHEKLTINWIKVLKPTGEVLSDKPSQTQESDVPAGMVDPVYLNRKVLRASLSGVAVGTLIDYSYTREELKPFRTGDFFDVWRVTAGTTVRRSRFVVNAPKDMKLIIEEHNLPFTRTETTAHGRTTYTWATSEVPWTKGEMFAADSNTVAELVRIAAPGAWSDIGHWYAGLARDRYAPSAALRDTVRALVAHATTLNDSLRAIHRWVAQDIRYVSLSLGIGGFQPRFPDTVMRTGFGDCKDKATLFVAALGVLGVEAYPVLLNAGGRVDRSLPTIGQFDHAIAAIRRKGAYQYTDLTSGVTPFGELPLGDESEFGLVVHADGRTEEVTLPSDPPGANRLENHLTGTLSPDGMFNGRFEERTSGAAADGLRGAMRQRLDSTQRANGMRSLAQSIFPNAQGDSLVTFDGKDLQAAPTITMRIRHGQASVSSGTTDVLTVPFLHQMGAVGSTADQLATAGPRHYPINAAKILSTLDMVYNVRITLPPGWHARLPKSVSAPSPFGSYESAYSQEGADLVIHHRLHGAQGIFAPERIDDLIAWFRLIGTDRVQVVLIDHGG